MYSFDEKALVAELEAQLSQARVAFAAATATRQLQNYERLARVSKAQSEQRPHEIAALLWVDIQAASASFDRAEWSARLDEVMSLAPEEGDDWVIWHALADHALASLAYAIRCLLTPEPQEAAWAARRAYEAADQSAIRILGVQPGLPSTELAIKSHEVVQRELRRQREDLDLLSAGSIEEVRRRAFANELLTDGDAASLK